VRGEGRGGGSVRQGVFLWCGRVWRALSPGGRNRAQGGTSSVFLAAVWRDRARTFVFSKRAEAPTWPMESRGQPKPNGPTVFLCRRFSWWGGEDQPGGSDLGRPAIQKNRGGGLDGLLLFFYVFPKRGGRPPRLFSFSPRPPGGAGLRGRPRQAGRPRRAAFFGPPWAGRGSLGNAKGGVKEPPFCCGLGAQKGGPFTVPAGGSRSVLAPPTSRGGGGGGGGGRGGRGLRRGGNGGGGGGGGDRDPGRPFAKKLAEPTGPRSRSRASLSAGPCDPRAALGFVAGDRVSPRHQRVMAPRPSKIPSQFFRGGMGGDVK